MKIFVLGKSGFIGSHLIWDPTDRVETCGRIDGPEVLARIRDFKPDMIINLAAEGVLPQNRDKATMFETNIRLPYELGRYAMGAGCKYVHFGTCFELGLGQPWIDPYTLSKVAANGMLLELFRDRLELIRIIRPFNVFGPGEQMPRLLPSLRAAARDGRALRLSAANSLRNFVYIKDFARWFSAFMARQSGSSAFTKSEPLTHHVAFESAVTVTEFCRAAMEHLDPFELDRGEEGAVSCHLENHALAAKPPRLHRLASGAQGVALQRDDRYRADTQSGKGRTEQLHSGPCLK